VVSRSARMPSSFSFKTRFLLQGDLIMGLTGSCSSLINPSLCHDNAGVAGGSPYSGDARLQGEGGLPLELVSGVLGDWGSGARLADPRDSDAEGGYEEEKIELESEAATLLPRASAVVRPTSATPRSAVKRCAETRCHRGFLLALGVSVLLYQFLSDIIYVWMVRTPRHGSVTHKLDRLTHTTSPPPTTVMCLMSPACPAGADDDGDPQHGHARLATVLLARGPVGALPIGVEAPFRGPRLGQRPPGQCRPGLDSLVQAPNGAPPQRRAGPAEGLRRLLGVYPHGLGGAGTQGRSVHRIMDPPPPKT
jgi:hypothetical protein